MRLDPSDPETHPSEPEPKSIALGVINELKEEEDMSNNLRVGFKERHRKCLHEAINMAPSPVKKTCPKRVQEEPAREVPPMVVPLSDVARSSSAPVVEKDTGGKEVGPATRETSGGVAPVEEASDKKDTPILASPPSCDEMMEMLKCVPCFTDAKTPSTKNVKFHPPH